MDKWAPPSLGLHMPGHVGPFVFTKNFNFSRGSGFGGKGTQEDQVFRPLAPYSFAPVAVETLGVWGPEAEDLLEELGRRMVRL